MGDSALENEEKIAELRALVETIRDRVRSQYPGTSATADSEGPDPIRVPFADLMPIVHARDAAQAKMASIGSVNPRAGGLVNSLVQSVKRSIARTLNWFVRDQIVFNRGALACVEATVEALNDLNRALASLGSQIDGKLQKERQRLTVQEAKSQELSGALGQLAAQWNREHAELAKRDARRDAEWRSTAAAGDVAVAKVGEEFHRAVGQFEARALATERSFADLAKTQHEQFLQLSRAQHAEFSISLEHAARDLQKKLDEDLQRIKLDFERVIHNELRTVRQRGLSQTIAVAPSQSAVTLDYQAFSNRFRGSEDRVLQSHQFYSGRFQGDVLDIGCGHGEFLEVMRESGVRAKGIDLSEESIAYCRAKGLDVEQADLFIYLDGLAGRSLDGIFSSQVVEHLNPGRIPDLIRLCASKLKTGGLIALETPNPECLAIFATHFYLDPTHVRPVPSALLAFYLEENGMGGIEVVTRSPAADSFPELNELPEPVRKRFFGGLDYVIFARKL